MSTGDWSLHKEKELTILCNLLSCGVVSQGMKYQMIYFQLYEVKMKKKLMSCTVFNMFFSLVSNIY